MSVPQVPVLRVLLSADLKGVQYFSTLEEAGGYRQSLERGRRQPVCLYPAGSAWRTEPWGTEGRALKSQSGAREDGGWAVRTVSGAPLVLGF